MLPTHIPDLEIHIVEIDQADVLPDGGHGVDFCGTVGWVVEGFDLLEEGGFAGIVEAEEEDGVLCTWPELAGRVVLDGKSVRLPSLLVACKYRDLTRWYIAAHLFGGRRIAQSEGDRFAVSLRGAGLLD